MTKDQTAEDLYIAAQTGQLPDDPDRRDEVLSIIKSIRPFTRTFCAIQPKGD